MILKGRLAEIMANMDTKLHNKYVLLEKGVMVLYVKLQKAQHVLLSSAILFNIKLEKYLKNNDFIINQYDPYVGKKMVKGKTMNMVWKIDDLKMSHEEPFEATKFSEYLSTIYGKKLKVHKGKVHDYIGKDLDYSEIRLVNFLMIK